MSDAPDDRGMRDDDSGVAFRDRERLARTPAHDVASTVSRRGSRPRDPTA